MPRPRQGFYPEVSTVGRALRWQDGCLEIQQYRNVLIRPLPRKESKAPRSPRSRLREGQLQPRVGIEEGAQVMDFDSYAAFFALSPEGEAELTRREREDAERNAANQAEAEAVRVAKELEQVEKAKRRKS